MRRATYILKRERMTYLRSWREKSEVRNGVIYNMILKIRKKNL